MCSDFGKPLDFSMFLVCALIGFCFSFIHTTKLPSEIFNISEGSDKVENHGKKAINLYDPKIIMNEVNLLTKKNKINEQDLYEHVSEKDRNVNERSFILIHGSKFKIPYLNSVPQPKKGYNIKKDYKTFVSNLDSAELNKIGERPHRFENSHVQDFKEPFLKLKNSHNTYEPSKYDYNRNSPTYFEHEMNAMSKKLKAANGAIGLQYHDTKLINQLINMHSKFPGLMVSEKKQKYPKETQIKLKVIPVSKGEKIIKTDMANIESKNSQKGYGTGNVPVNPAVYHHHFVTPATIQHYDMNTYSENRNDPNIHKTKKEKSNQLKSNKNTDDHREYFELLKPPILRSNVEVNHNSNQYNSKPFESLNIDQYQPSFKKYNMKPIPSRMKNDLEYQHTAINNIYDPDVRRGETQVPLKYIDYNEEENHGEPEFKDARLLKKIEEIKHIDAQLQEVDIQREHEKKNIRDEYVHNPLQEIKNKNVIRPEVNKSSCVHPVCEIKQHKQSLHKYKMYPHKDKCKCDHDKTTSMSSKVDSLDDVEEITPVNAIRGLEEALT